ncbi:MAG: FG-GAP-like repeat-containing protein [bacterium]
MKTNPLLCEASLEKARGIAINLNIKKAVDEIDEELMRLYDFQLLKGQALDQLWLVFVNTGNFNALADYVIKSTETEIDTRGLDSILSGYLSNDPRNPFVWRAAGLLAWSKGDFRHAKELLQKAAASIENDPQGRFAWAECRKAMGLSFEPDQIMDKAIETNAPNVNTQEARRLYFVGRLWEGQGKTENAMASLVQSVKLNPDDPESWIALARMKRILGDKTGSEDAESKGKQLSDDLNILKKLHENFRKGNDTLDLKNKLAEITEKWRLDAVARAWNEFKFMPNRGSFAVSQLEIFGRNIPTPDRFFQARPKLRSKPIKLPDWTSEDLRNKTENNQPIQFVEIKNWFKPDAYQYQSFEKPESLKIADVMGGGVAVADFNGDGQLDLLFPGSCDFNQIQNIEMKSTTKLFLGMKDNAKNTDEIQFVDATEKSGLVKNGYFMGSAVGDFNNDARPDIYMTGYGRSILFQNMGNGRFEDVTQKAGVTTNRWTTAAAFADLDADGDQDLMAVTYVYVSPDQMENCVDNLNKPIHCSPGKFPAQSDILWENLGNGTFRDISVESGIAAAANGRGLGLAVADLDSDGRLDLFVANDASPNFYFHNEGGLKFKEMAAEAGLAVDGSGKATASMGVVANDLDEDGLIDLFHTNFLNEPNTFRKNLGNGLFIDSTFAMGLSASSLSRTGFGAVSFDADLDGHADLFVANGHLDNQPHIQTMMAQKPLFYRGQGKKGFQLIPENAMPYTGRSVVGRGMASGDFNNDGMVDLVVVHRDEPVALLKNSSVRQGNWLGIALKPSGSFMAPAGTKIKISSGGKIQHAWVSPGTSYLSSSDPRLVFGLDPMVNEATVEVSFPAEKGKPARTISNIVKELNRYIEITN